MKTTAGTWNAVAQMPEGYSIENEQGQVIAFSQCDEEYNDDNPITKDEEFANALCLAASKDLLEALQALVEYLDFDLSEGEIILKEKAQQAINKATNQ